MTDQEVLDFYQKLVDEYGDKLPNPDHHPKQFEYFVRLYRHVERTRASSAEGA